MKKVSLLRKSGDKEMVDDTWEEMEMETEISVVQMQLIVKIDKN